LRDLADLPMAGRGREADARRIFPFEPVDLGASWLTSSGRGQRRHSETSRRGDADRYI